MIKPVTTPGFRDQGHSGFITIALGLIGGRGEEPSMIVGDPECTKTTTEDEGRTVRVPVAEGPKVWAIRDDYPKEEVLTFLLPEEY